MSTKIFPALEPESNLWPSLIIFSLTSQWTWNLCSFYLQSPFLKFPFLCLLLLLLAKSRTHTHTHTFLCTHIWSQRLTLGNFSCFSPPWLVSCFFWFYGFVLGRTGVYVVWFIFLFHSLLPSLPSFWDKDSLTLDLSHCTAFRDLPVSDPHGAEIIDIFYYTWLTMQVLGNQSQTLMSVQQALPTLSHHPLALLYVS